MALVLQFRVADIRAAATIGCLWVTREVKSSLMRSTSPIWLASISALLSLSLCNGETKQLLLLHELLYSGTFHMVPFFVYCNSGKVLQMVDLYHFTRLMLGEQSTKTMEIGPLKNIPLYGICMSNMYAKKKKKLRSFELSESLQTWR